MMEEKKKKKLNILWFQRFNQTDLSPFIKINVFVFWLLFVVGRRDLGHLSLFIHERINCKNFELIKSVQKKCYGGAV